MSVAARLGAYGLVLVVMLGAGAAVGQRFDSSVAPAPDAGRPGPQQHDGGGGTGAEPVTEEEEVMGLSISSGGYRLERESAELRPGVAHDLRFRIMGPDGEPLRAYDEVHERRLHLIVVSRDLAWFEHVHPELDDEGTWHQALTLPAAGAYRVYADFTPAGGENLVLGTDLSAAGEYRPAPAAPVEAETVVDGYTVTRHGELVAGGEAEIRFSVERDGRPVADLDPYLGAAGHLVALRVGDLAYLHVHPTSEDLGPEVRFAAHVPSAGSYRLFLDFSHGGVVRTAAFTMEAPTGPGHAVPAGGQTTHDAGAHGH